MKKIMNKANFAIVGLMASMAPAMAADDGICSLVRELGRLLGMLRTLAFIGAGFTIAGWAWGFISGGKVDIEKDLKPKGVGLLVGFVLLFGVGTVITFLMNAAEPGGSLNCMEEFKAW
jgi:hypothetical protein